MFHSAQPGQIQPTPYQLWLRDLTRRRGELITFTPCGFILGAFGRRRLRVVCENAWPCPLHTPEVQC